MLFSISGRKESATARAMKSVPTACRFPKFHHRAPSVHQPSPLTGRFFSNRYSMVDEPSQREYASSQSCPSTVDTPYDLLQNGRVQILARFSYLGRGKNRVDNL